MLDHGGSRCLSWIHGCPACYVAVYRICAQKIYTTLQEQAGSASHRKRFNSVKGLYTIEGYRSPTTPSKSSKCGQFREEKQHNRTHRFDGFQWATSHHRLKLESEQQRPKMAHDFRCVTFSSVLYQDQVDMK